MTSILVIASDSRVLQLADRIGLHVSGSLFISDNLEKGIEKLFQKRPAAVLIELDLNEASGESFSSHIKAILREKAPRFILLQTSPVRVFSPGTNDSILDMSREQADLEAALLDMLADVPGVRRQQTSAMEWLHAANLANVSSRKNDAGLPPGSSYLVGIPANQFKASFPAARRKKGFRKRK